MTVEKLEETGAREKKGKLDSDGTYLNFCQRPKETWQLPELIPRCLRPVCEEAESTDHICCPPGDGHLCLLVQPSPHCVLLPSALERKQLWPTLSKALTPRRASPPGHVETLPEKIKVRLLLQFWEYL